MDIGPGRLYSPTSGHLSEMHVISLHSSALEGFYCCKLVKSSDER
jgi:hypothetical protein